MTVQDDGAEARQNHRPGMIRSTDELGPVGWRYVPSDVWGDQVLTQNPQTAQLARVMGRDVEPLYTEAQMLARVAAERARRLPDVDELAQHIRWLNGSNKMGAGTLAEKLVDWLRSRA